MAEGSEIASTLDSDELAEPATGDILEEDALDRSLGAEVEDLGQRRHDQSTHGSIVHDGRTTALQGDACGE